MTASKPSAAQQRRSAARLLAVQALYQTTFTDMPVDQAIDLFLRKAIGGQALEDDDILETEHVVDLSDPDPELFSAIVRGAAKRLDDIDGMIAGALSEGWSKDRLEATLRAILRSGVWEILEKQDVPARVVISEYVDVAHAFYAGPEPKLVNAVLDKLAKTVRPHEFE